MVVWHNPDLFKLNRELIPNILRKEMVMSFLDAVVTPLAIIQQETLYTSQHNSSKIYLEKVLNDYYNISGFDPNMHETTKKIYIENIPRPGSVFIYQPLENSAVFLGDSTNSNEVFIKQMNENVNPFSFTIFIPDTVVFDEQDLRAQFDKYASVGKLYNIQTYTI
ncbi:hypothetical protein [Flavobacterium sp. N1994]|uniref:hypothetical protein n=1 Tax=Flavobacterium sp. N1994 TaxID=2986827 RepID=UPI0022213264|nr:hypothetical protein [Flavobacterium sp. N1994]